MASDSYPLSHGSLAGLTSTDHHTQYALPQTGPASTRPTGSWRFGRMYYSNDTQGFSFDTGAGWLDLTTAASKKTVRIPHTFTISGPVAVASGDTNYIPPFFVPVPTGQTVKYVGCRYRINSGTSAEFSLFRNPYSGGDNNFTPALAAATTTAYTAVDTTTYPGADVIADGDAVRLVISAISGAPQNMTVTLYFDYSF